jgi:hypothetical protein
MLILLSSQGFKLDPESEAITINKQQLTDTSRPKQNQALKLLKAKRIHEPTARRMLRLPKQRRE